MKNQHTPGPWKAKEHFRNFTSNDIGHFILWRDTSKPGECWTRLDDKKGSFPQADAVLIAAAPDLLEALRAIEDHHGETEEWRELARAAIAKATQ